MVSFASPEFHPAKRFTYVLIAGLWLATAVPAQANGAMGMVLATFAWDTWTLYVTATVIFEALVMGRWLRLPLRTSLPLSLGANLLTGMLGGFISGILAYPFLGVFGSRLNPDPFGQTLLLLTLFGVVSAYVEAGFWMRPREAEPKPVRKLILRRSLVVHLVGVPLALGILLIPDRPYGGLEEQVAAQRWIWLRNEVSRALTGYVERHHALPSDATYSQVLERLRPWMSSRSKDPGLWTAGYLPRYGRFDRSERRRAPIEWNGKAAREFRERNPPRTLWLARFKTGSRCQGLVIDTVSGTVTASSRPEALGWPDHQVADRVP